jgi:uncharacterized membrane protein YbaN (DUF454 family)
MSYLTWLLYPLIWLSPSLTIQILGLFLSVFFTVIIVVSRFLYAKLYANIYAKLYTKKSLSPIIITITEGDELIVVE